MKPPFAPTKVTALASGALLGFAMPLQESISKAIGASAQTQNMIFLLALVGCFFGPVLLFVIGPRYLLSGWRDLGAKSYWAEFWQVTVRALHWLLGAALSFAILATLGF